MPAAPASDAVAPGEVEAVMSAARVLVAVVTASIVEVEGQVSLPQLRVLVLAAGHGSLTLGAVAAALGVHPSNATRTCDRLVVAGLLDRRDDPADRRQLRLTLTPDGQRLVDSVMAHRREAIATVMTGMQPQVRRRLATALEAFAEAAGQVDEHAASASSWGT